MSQPDRRRVFYLLAAGLTLAIGPACSSTPKSEQTDFIPSRFSPWEDASPVYQLYPGDEIEITVHTANELSGQVSVRPDGRVSLPLAGDVSIAGLTPDEANIAITDRYRSVLRNPIIGLRPTAFASQKILVGGEVNQPGIFDINSNRTGVLEAIMMAGGVTKRARRSNIVVLRRSDSGKVMLRTVNLSKALKGKSADLIPLARHDIVFVPRSRIAEINDWTEQYIRGVLPLDSVFNYALYEAMYNNNN